MNRMHVIKGNWMFSRQISIKAFCFRCLLLFLCLEEKNKAQIVSISRTHWDANGMHISLLCQGSFLVYFVEDKSGHWHHICTTKDGLSVGLFSDFAKATTGKKERPIGLEERPLGDKPNIDSTEAVQTGLKRDRKQGCIYLARRARPKAERRAAN